MEDKNFEKFKRKIKYVFEGNEEELKKIYGDKSFIDIMFEDFKSILKAYQNKNSIVKLINYLIPLFLENYDKLLTKNEYIDKDLLKELQKRLSESYKKNQMLFMEICNSYLKDFIS